MQNVQSTPVAHIKKTLYFTGKNRGKGLICINKIGMNNLVGRVAVNQSTAYSEKRLFTKRPGAHIILHQMKCDATNIENSCTNDPKSNNSEELLPKICKYLNAFYEFCRPHTIYGTVIGITSVSLLAVRNPSDFSPIFFIGLLKALIPAIFMNIYVVGLNQIYDIEIDKVNKPNLPLASGELNLMNGIILVISSLFMSFLMGMKSQSPPLLCALFISFLLGSAYSIDLPFLRWKRHAFLAALCILCVRAILVQLAFFAHMQVYVLGRPLSLTVSVIFATAFMCFFSAVIALFKDIPDVNGDRDFGIESFSVRLGQKKVFWLCIKLLLIAYGLAVLVGVFSTKVHLRLISVFGHAILASSLWLRARCLDVENKGSVVSFYMFIWKLFYAEYFLIPFMH